MGKPGDDLEKIVALIEKSISKDAEVKQNVDLPVINSPSGRTRQCDVVITNGNGVRKTTTIVEVQDRNSAVSIGTFCDWLEKLNEVGANQLICISRKEFPVSVKEKAILQGNRVFLITLKEALPEALPLDMISFRMVYKHVAIVNDPNVRIGVPQGTLSSHKALPSSGYAEDKVWSENQQDMISLLDVIRSKIKEIHAGESGVIKGSLELSFADNNNLWLYLLLGDTFIKVGVEIKVDYIYDNHDIPMSVSSYEQIDSGVLAWVFESEIITSQGKHSLKHPVTKREDGMYQGLGLVHTSDVDSRIEIVEDPEAKRSETTPPRNGRTNKALRALGYPVKINF